MTTLLCFECWGELKPSRGESRKAPRCFLRGSIVACRPVVGTSPQLSFRSGQPSGQRAQPGYRSRGRLIKTSILAYGRPRLTTMNARPTTPRAQPRWRVLLVELYLLQTKLRGVQLSSVRANSGQIESAQSRLDLLTSAVSRQLCQIYILSLCDETVGCMLRDSVFQHSKYASYFNSIEDDY